MIMNQKAEWIRVSQKTPCPICGKDNWCTYTEDGASCCMRSPTNKPMKNGGWLHLPDAHRKPIVYFQAPRKSSQEVTVDIPSIWRGMMKDWVSAGKSSLLKIKSLADSLGVDVSTLDGVGCAWSENYQAWAFAMRDANDQVIGIRLRNEQGEKWAVKSSKAGLFYCDWLLGPTCYIVEGPTDTAAAMTLGVPTIGRPSCLGSEDLVNSLLERKKVKRVIIVPDHDKPDKNGRRAGLAGALTLQVKIKIPSMIWTPPAKDIREFLINKGSVQLMETMSKGLLWKNPTGE